MPTIEHNSSSGGKRSSERRHLTVLFSDLSDSTALAASVEAEVYADLLAELVQCFELIIPRHGGVISQIQGDGVLAMFGFDAREDEGRRATEAALELHEAVKNLTFRSPHNTAPVLTMHSGIHSGLVLVIEGDQMMGRYMLIGDAANLASRLADEAEADEILVSENSLGADMHFFAHSPPRQLQLKGHEGYLVTYSVEGRSAINTRFEALQQRGLAPIIGRERELNALHTALDQVQRQRSLRIVEVIGSGGMGKTRLVEEFLTQVDSQPLTLCRGYSESYLNAEPLQPLLQMCRSILELEPTSPRGLRDEIVADRMPDKLRQIAPELGQHADVFQSLLVPSVGGEKIGDLDLTPAITALFRALARQSPVVAFFDDWQWVDDASRGIAQSMDMLQASPILIIRATRQAVTDSSRIHQQLMLSPLTAAQSLRLVDQLLPEVDAYVANHIEQASGGNPLFVEELCHSIARSGGIDEALDEAEQVPNHLQMLIESRISSLSGPLRVLVRAAAVIGNVVPLWLLSFLTGLQTEDDVIKHLAGMDVLFPSGANSLRFKHGITREVVLNSIGLHERQEMHRNVARVIERSYPVGQRDEFLEMLAYHYGEAEEFEPAARYATAAGDKAMLSAAVDRARSQYQAALKALDRGEWTEEIYRQWMSVAEKLAFSSLYDARSDLVPIYQRAVDLATERNDTVAISDAEYWLAYVSYALGDAPSALKHSGRFMSLADHIENQALQTQLLASRGLMAGAACQYDEALPALNDALGAQRPFRNKPRISFAFAYSLGAMGMVHGDMGEFEAANACFDEAQSVLNDVVHQTQSSIASMRSAVYLWQGRWQDALDHADRTVAVAQRMGSRYVVAVGNAQRCYANYRLGKDGAVDEFTRTIAWLSSYEQALWTSLHYGWYCQVMAEMGRYPESRTAAARTLLRARKLERLGESVVYCALASIPEGEFSNYSPETCFAKARRSADARRSRREHAIIDLHEAEHQLKMGNQERALELLTCQSEFSAMGMHWYSSRARKLSQKCAGET